MATGGSSSGEGRWSPGIVSDAPDGPDLLGVDADAGAMARILMSRTLAPPLTIGVFGNWGSGKTFFLRRLHEHVRGLSVGPQPTWPSHSYVKKVVQISFNAWHFSEANLWSSIAYVLFEGLRASDTSDRQDRVGEVLAQLETSIRRRAELDAERTEAQAEQDYLQRSLEEFAERGRHKDARADLERQLASATARLESSEKALQEFGNASELSQYIARRASSDVEGERLGALALMRRDFERLSSLLLLEPRSHAFEDNAPSVVDRVVFYIDDLDRCSPDRVVATLEAIHLLLAFPLFVTVVAVDARWLSAALKDRFSASLSAPSAHDRGSGAEHASTQDYLEKIFQVPYWLPQLSPDRTRRLLRSWLGVQEPSVAGSPGPVAAPMPEPPGTPPEIEADELSYMEQLAPLIGRSPRAVKRFVNVYQFVRSSVGWHGEEGQLAEPAMTLLVLALVHGAPELASSVFNHVESSTGKTPAGALITSLDTAPGIVGSKAWPTVKPQVEEFVRAHGKHWTAESMSAAIRRARRFSFLDFRS